MARRPAGHRPAAVRAPHVAAQGEVLTPRRLTRAVVVAGLSWPTACAVGPDRASLAVVPGAGKSALAFDADQVECRRFARRQVRGQASRSNAEAVGDTLLGTVLGAALGGGIGAGLGAGIGALGGGLGMFALGTGATLDARARIQQQYDLAYAQCMYARGDRVPSLPEAAPAPITAAAPITVPGRLTAPGRAP